VPVLQGSRVAGIERQDEGLPACLFDEGSALLQPVPAPSAERDTAACSDGDRGRSAHPAARAGDPHDPRAFHQRAPAISYARCGSCVASLPPLTSIRVPVM
jgi:hypothetical protein